MRIVAQRRMHQLSESPPSPSPPRPAAAASVRSARRSARCAPCGRARFPPPGARSTCIDLADLRSRELQRGPQSEQNRRRQRHANAEEEHGKIDADHHLRREGDTAAAPLACPPEFHRPPDAQRRRRSRPAAATRSAVAAQCGGSRRPHGGRTANSCCRAVPRASSRIDTFPHPIASNSATAPNSRYNVPLMPLAHPLVEPLDLHPEVLGKVLGRVAAQTASSSGCSAASAASWVTPGLRRRSTMHVGPGSCVSFSGR